MKNDMGKVLCLFQIDPSTHCCLPDGKRPTAAFSHTTNSYYLAQEALRLGCRAGFIHVGSEIYTEVEAVYPVVKVASRMPLLKAVAERIVYFTIFPASMPLLSQQIPSGTARQGVLMVAATHWLEEPELYDKEFVEKLREAVLYDIDDVITQNKEMAELFRALAVLTGGAFDKSRTLIAPCGYVPEDEGAILRLEKERAAIRQEMGLGDRDVAIINSGGVWKWTDLDTFLQAFIEFHRENPGNPLKLFLMGLCQSDNVDHKEYIARFNAMLDANKDLLDSGAIRVLRDWEKAGKLLPRWNFGADLGVNVSKATMENAQSFRQRFVEYIKAGLPVINTQGDPMSRSDFRKMMLLVEPERGETYKEAFAKATKDAGVLAAMRKEGAALRERIRSDRVYRPVLAELISRGPIPLAVRQERIEALSRYRGYAELRSARGEFIPKCCEPVEAPLEVVEKKTTPLWGDTRVFARRATANCGCMLRTLVRRSLKLAWWTVTLQLPRKIAERMRG
jgi:hypothetical protein